MSAKNDGGPAFPHLETTSRGEPFHDHLGMTLRDYFAAKAMQGICADPNVNCEINQLAERSYAVADAMLAARSKGGAA